MPFSKKYDSRFCTRRLVAFGLALLYAVVALTGDSLYYLQPDQGVVGSIGEPGGEGVRASQESASSASADAKPRASQKLIVHRHGRDSIPHVHRLRQSTSRIASVKPDAAAISSGSHCRRAVVTHFDHDCTLLALVRCLSQSHFSSFQLGSKKSRSTDGFAKIESLALQGVPTSLLARGPPVRSLPF